MRAWTSRTSAHPAWAVPVCCTRHRPGRVGGRPGCVPGAVQLALGADQVLGIAGITHPYAMACSNMGSGEASARRAPADPKWATAVVRALLDLDTVTGPSLFPKEVVSMTTTRQDMDAIRALQGLEDRRSSVRMRAALAVGTTPDPRFVDKLIERCAIEPDSFVRDMLTWALTRHPASMTLPELLGEVRSERAQARSQALHTLSKIGDRQAWWRSPGRCCPTPTTRWRGAPGGPR